MIGRTVLALTLVLIGGCKSLDGRGEASAASFQRLERLEISVGALGKQQQKTECLVRLSMVQSTCMALYAGEANSLALQNKLAACVRSRGFPNGSDGCQ